MMEFRIKISVLDFESLALGYGLLDFEPWSMNSYIFDYGLRFIICGSMATTHVLLV